MFKCFQEQNLLNNEKMLEFHTEEVVKIWEKSWKFTRTNSYRYEKKIYASQEQSCIFIRKKNFRKHFESFTFLKKSQNSKFIRI